MADPVTPTAPADDPSSEAGASASTPPTTATKGAGAADPVRKKKVVKKIVKKVPVASPPGAGTRPAPRTGAGPAARPSVPLAKQEELRRLPPPPPAGRRPVPEPIASAEEVRRVGPLQRRRLGRLRARKVRRILRHVEVWSVLKVSAVFFFCLWLVLLVSGALIWKVANQAGLIDNVENFLQESGFDEVEFDGETMFRAWASGGFVMVFASTGFAVLMAVLFNLISDLMGGVRFTVIELETIRRRKPGRDRRQASRPSNRP